MTLLVENGADVTSTMDRSSKTPLQYLYPYWTFASESKPIKELFEKIANKVLPKEAVLQIMNGHVPAEILDTVRGRCPSPLAQPPLHLRKELPSDSSVQEGHAVLRNPIVDSQTSFPWTNFIDEIPGHQQPPPLSPSQSSPLLSPSPHLSPCTHPERRSAPHAGPENGHSSAEPQQSSTSRTLGQLKQRAAKPLSKLKIMFQSK
jgi:hypothetical protein